MKRLRQVKRRIGSTSQERGRPRPLPKALTRFTKRTRRPRSWWGILLLVSVAGLRAEPSAEAIMEKVRIFQSSQRQELEGQIRSEGDRTPFHLSVDGGSIRYQLRHPAQTIAVNLGRDGSTASGAGFTDPIRDTDLTLEDISMPFLYWDKLEFDGEKTVFGGRPSWQIKAYAPSRKNSSYGMVRVWVEKDSGALLKVEAYGWDGKAAKRFEVKGIQRYHGGWLLKQMRIQSLQGTRSRDKTPTYLEIEKPE